MVSHDLVWNLRQPQLIGVLSRVAMVGLVGGGEGWVLPALSVTLVFQWLLGVGRYVEGLGCGPKANLCAGCPVVTTIIQTTT